MGGVRGNIIYNYGVREWLLITGGGGGATKPNWGVGASEFLPQTCFSHTEGAARKVLR